jgi:DNA-binding PadR family transcriptional regulator
VLNSTSLICETAFEENILPEEQIIEKHVKTFLDIIILAMLNGKVTYGYKIIAVIHTEFGVLLSPASLYPLLHFLEQNKLVESIFDQGKTMYRLTSKGKDTLERKLALYNLSIQTMSNFMKVHGKIW